MIAPTGLPESIKYKESVKDKLNIRHDKEFIRREESKLYELIATLPEDEIARLEEPLDLIPSIVSNNNNN